MRILYTRYFNQEYSYCLATAVQNNIQEPGCVTGDTLGRLHGRHPNNEHDMDEEAELSNAMAYLVMSGHAAGDNGHYIVEEKVVMNGREIEAESPMFQGFAIEKGEKEMEDAKLFESMITGSEQNPNPNEFMFVRFIVTFIAEGNDPPKIVHHWGNITKLDETTWWIGHGIMESNPVRIRQDNLVRLLFTKAGRDTLSALIQDDFGGSAVVDFDTSLFLALPKIQLQGPRKWNDGIDYAKTLPFVFINNGKTKKTNMHMYQMVDMDKTRFIG